MNKANQSAFPGQLGSVSGLSKREYIATQILASKNARLGEFSISIAIEETLKQTNALLSALSEPAPSVDREPLKEVTGREKEIRDCNYKDDNAKPGSFDSDAWKCASIAYLLGLLDSEREKSVNQEKSDD